MRNIFGPLVRHVAAALVGAGAAWATVKTGVVLGQDVVEPIAAALAVGFYGAVNHIAKAIRH